MKRDESKASWYCFVGQKGQPICEEPEQNRTMWKERVYTQGEQAQVDCLESWPPASVWLDTDVRRPCLPEKEPSVCAVGLVLEETLPKVTPVGTVWKSETQTPASLSQEGFGAAAVRLHQHWV